MKIPIAKKKIFFLKIGIFFQNWEKSHLNSIGYSASENTKKNPCNTTVFLFVTKTYVVDTQKNDLNETPKDMFN